MAEINTIIYDLQKGKNVSSNLSIYTNMMLTNGNRFSNIRLALNYPMFKEIVEDVKQTKFISKKLYAVIEEVDNILKNLSKECVTLDKIRGIRINVKENMETLTAYADRFMIYEYVLNRLEYTFKSIPELFLDEEECKQHILSALQSEKEDQLILLKWMQILEQLPLRMTKNRFFQILKDGIGVYKGVEKKTFLSLMYMLRTTAMLDSKDEWIEEYPEFYQFIEQLSQLDYKTITKEQFEQVYNTLKTQMAHLDELINIVTLLQEIVNDIYVISLSQEQAISDVSEKNICNKIIETVACLHDEEIGNAIENLYEEFEKLEGKQEHCYSKFLAGESVLDEFLAAYEKEIKNCELEKSFSNLKDISNLISSSIFVDLEEDIEADEVVSEEYLNEWVGKLILDLKEAFSNKNKMVVRAIMSKLLIQLPPFISNGQDIVKYIEDAFASCENKAEKAASIEVILSLTNDEY